MLVVEGMLKAFFAKDALGVWLRDKDGRWRLPYGEKRDEGRVCREVCTAQFDYE